MINVLFSAVLILSANLALATTAESADEYQAILDQLSRTSDFQQQHDFLTVVSQNMQDWTPAQQGNIYQKLGTAAGEIGDLEGAERYLSKAINLLIDTPLDEPLVISYLERSFFRYLATGDAGYFCPDRYKALALVRQLPSPSLQARTLAQTAFCATTADDAKQGLTYLQEALEIAKQNTLAPADIALIYNATGNIYRTHGLHQKAYDYISQAYQHWASVNDTQDMFNMQHTLTSEAISLQKLELAQQHVDRMFELANQADSGDDFGFFAHLNQGVVAQAQGDFDKAYQHFLAAQKLETTTHEKLFVDQLYIQLAMIAWKLKKTDDAMSFISAYGLQEQGSDKNSILVNAFGAAAQNDVQSLVDALFALDKFHQQRLSEVVQNQISLVAFEHDSVLAEMNNQILEKQLAISQLELARQQNEQAISDLSLYLALSLTGVLAIAAITLLFNVRRYKYAAEVDYLTGALNRRSAYRIGQQTLRAVNKTDASFCLIAMDVDYFKAVNDKYGHDAGDLVLKKITQACTQHLRKSDYIARTGGEEFLILLDDTDLDAALDIAERIRVTIAKLPLTSANHAFSVTSSFGLTQSTQDDSDFEQLVTRADQALYQAKASGRNRVVTS